MKKAIKRASAVSLAPQLISINASTDDSREITEEEFKVFAGIFTAEYSELKNATRSPKKDFDPIRVLQKRLANGIKGKGYPKWINRISKPQIQASYSRLEKKIPVSRFNANGKVFKLMSSKTGLDAAALTVDQQPPSPSHPQPSAGPPSQ